MTAPTITHNHLTFANGTLVEITTAPAHISPLDVYCPTAPRMTHIGRVVGTITIQGCAFYEIEISGEKAVFAPSKEFGHWKLDHKKTAYGIKVQSIPVGIVREVREYKETKLAA